MKRVSRFQGQSRGTAYACRHCNHNTRETGDGESDVRLCAPCYHLSGIANALSDNGLEHSLCYAPEVRALIATIEQRGKGDAGWRAELAALLTCPTCKDTPTGQCTALGVACPLNLMKVPA